MEMSKGGVVLGIFLLVMILFVGMQLGIIYEKSRKMTPIFINKANCK